MEKYFFEAFENMERLGPGSEKETIKALSYMDKNKPIKVLDIGCGVGTHTFLIAKHLKNAEIIAIDNNKDYIDILNQKAKTLNLSHRVTGICMSMFQMEFDNNSFDYIFSEGAIYIQGFKSGLSNWKNLLKKDGILICSEISWITDTPSNIPYKYWTEAYKEIDTVNNKIALAKELGYDVVDTFLLEKTAWTDNYYTPLKNNIDKMQLKYKDNKLALSVVHMINEEITMYEKYGNEYTYVFYILKIKK